MIDIEKACIMGKDRIVLRTTCVCCDSEDNEVYSLREFLDVVGATLDDCKAAFGEVSDAIE